MGGRRAGANVWDALVVGDEQDRARKKYEERADAVLVDVPCTGSGSLRRNPELRLRTPNLAALTQLQFSILRAAAKLLKPGGRLIYATCSLLAEENEIIVARFLRERTRFVQAPAASLRLLPHRAGTVRFFAYTLPMRACVSRNP